MTARSTAGSADFSIKGLVLDGTLAQSPREAKELWTLREGISESISTLGVPHKNDIALPIAALEPFVAEMLELFKKHGEFKMFLFGHIGDGNLHVNTLKPADMPLEQFLKRCHSVDQELFAIVRKYRGASRLSTESVCSKKIRFHFHEVPRRSRSSKA